VAENRPYTERLWYVTVVNGLNREGYSFGFTGYAICADYAPVHLPPP
jgi:hypothetical protein